MQNWTGEICYINMKCSKCYFSALATLAVFPPTPAPLFRHPTAAPITIRRQRQLRLSAPRGPRRPQQLQEQVPQQRNRLCRTGRPARNTIAPPPQRSGRWARTAEEKWTEGREWPTMQRPMADRRPRDRLGEPTLCQPVSDSYNDKKINAITL